MNRVKTELNLF